MFNRFKKTGWLFTFIILCAGSISAQPLWQSGDYTADLKNDALHLFHQDTKIVEITSFAFNFVPAEIMGASVTDDNRLVLKLELAGNDGHHEEFPEEIELTLSQTDHTFHLSAGHETFNHITIKMQDQDEHYFGLIEKLYPENRKSPDLRGETVDVEVYANGERDYAENYASAYSAFFMSSNGYGSFFDTFAKGTYTFARNGTTEIYHQTDSLDWYLFYGPQGDDIHKEYFEVIGAPKYVPIWAVGPVVWRDYNENSDEILSDMQHFADLEIPLTATFVDRPYSDGNHEWSEMNFAEGFKNPEEWIGTINEKYGMEFMSWVGSLTFGDEDFPGLLPNYKTYIDLTDPEALEEFERRMSKQYEVGIKGHKMDRADEGFPMTAKWHDPVGESETRNKYPYLYAKTIDDFLRKAHGQDQFNFARAAYHGSQQYLSAIWGGDNRSNWIGMAGNQANAIRTSFQGFPVWGNDTGGYLGEGRIDQQLYIRWLQWSSWNGMFEVKLDGMGGAGNDRVPWHYSDTLQKVFRSVCETRMDLLPYGYSMANTSADNGVLMKPLAYMYPSDTTTYSIWDEYIFGDTFLVAPVFGPEFKRDIYFPEGTWYDFNNPAASVEGPVTKTVDVPLEEIPVYIKQNSIYVTGDIYRGNSKIWKGELEGNEQLTIHLYPGETGQETAFTYVDHMDGDQHKQMSLATENNTVTFSSKSLTIPHTIQVKTDEEPESVKLNGSSADYDFDEESGLISIESQSKAGLKLVINY